MAEAGVDLDVVHTSLQTRAIRTANLALDELDRLVAAGAAAAGGSTSATTATSPGKNKAETADRVRRRAGPHLAAQLRRPAPQPIADDNPITRTAIAATRRCRPTCSPPSECLKDVVDRMLPYWYDAIVPDLPPGGRVLVAAHGNSLRALVKHLDGISDDDIAELNIPTGVPLVYELDDAYQPIERRAPLDRALGDPEMVRAAAEAVARQARRD